MIHQPLRRSSAFQDPIVWQLYFEQFFSYQHECTKKSSWRMWQIITACLIYDDFKQRFWLYSIFVQRISWLNYEELRILAIFWEYRYTPKMTMVLARTKLPALKKSMHLEVNCWPRKTMNFYLILKWVLSGTVRWTTITVRKFPQMPTWGQKMTPERKYTQFVRFSPLF